MHPSIHAKNHPDKPAIIMATTGETVTYAELDKRSNQLAHLFRKLGLGHGDPIAICMDNRARYFEIAWASQRSGGRLVAISSRLTESEIAYILNDSGAKMLIASDYLGDALDSLVANGPDIPRFTVDAARPGYESLDAALAGLPETPVADQRCGIDMLYSSGTTGRPKGVRIPLPENEAIDEPNGLTMLAQGAFGISEDSVYLSPAPLYHAAPLRWCLTVQKFGGTTVIMERFDPVFALQLIEKYKINASQWVPTHFVRMLKLPDEERLKYDVSSLTCAIHAAAPCPVPIKERMIEWWGPVLKEYYAGSEGNGMTFIDSENWLTHKGSVGRAILGIVHVCDEAGEEVPARTEGTIYFEGGGEFKYHNDPGKTEESVNPNGWTTLGDVGWVDEEGFLYLTDRKSFMIISGGVNIYPQEIENLLITHDKVADAAVIGAPDDDMGERVVAIVQPLDMADANDAFVAELTEFMRESLSGVKIPRQIDFLEELPRHPTGKLYKRLLRDEYWEKHKKQQA
jgi:acyl-CoA synthetase (AMP-forming)/AMP-acid ligase II